MKWYCLVLIFGVALCGCKKSGSAATANPLTNAVTAATPEQQPLVGTVDPMLTTVLKQFVQEKGRLPQNMVELKRANLDSLPRPPAGFTYAIDPVTVEVKLVKL